MSASRKLPLLVPALAALCVQAQAEDTRTPPPASGATVGQAVDNVISSMRWGAYGEMHYNNFQSETTHDTLEMHRFVLLAEAQLHEQVRLVSEIEIEHTLVEGDDTGALELEQAYLDWQYNENHGLRAGVMLVPISIGNLYHEPTLFHGVERPLMDHDIIPTTWFESGVGAHGRILPELEYTAAIQAGLYAGDGLEAENGIREARQKGVESKADDFTYTGRLDYRPIPGLWLATGALFGEMDQKDGFSSSVFLYTLEGRWNRDGWDLAATWAQGNIENPDEIPGYDPADPIAETFEGLCLTAAYDVLRLITESSQQFYVFGRYEIVDTQAELASGATANDELTRTCMQYGITYKPTPKIVLKADYRDEDNDAETAEDSWNLGVGFAF